MNPMSTNNTTHTPTDTEIEELQIEVADLGMKLGKALRETDTLTAQNAALVAALESAKFALETGRTDLDSCACTGINDTLRNVIDAALAAAKGQP